MKQLKQILFHLYTALYSIKDIVSPKQKTTLEWPLNLTTYII